VWSKIFAFLVLAALSTELFSLTLCQFFETRVEAYLEMSGITQEFHNIHSPISSTWQSSHSTRFLVEGSRH